ncbi:MAG: hypothetical protein K0Q92_1265 [Steroidobacteraceae bacterium]|jgi:hypothetical protein|nr:hypothetical protein [Steroidobacteraceae bacterium]
MGSLPICQQKGSSLHLQASPCFLEMDSDPFSPFGILAASILVMGTSL